MGSIRVLLQYGDQITKRPYLTTFTSHDNRLVFNDDRHAFSPERVTMQKFFLLTITSPLSSLVHLVRSVAFLFVDKPWAEKCGRSGRSFIGACFLSFVALGCFLGSLVAYAITFINGRGSMYIALRRAYAHFEAWVNGLNFSDPNLPSYSKRINRNAFHIFPCTSKKEEKSTWIAARCMQPIFERVWEKDRGLLNARRIEKLFPFVRPIREVVQDGENKLIIKTSYKDKDEYFAACNGCIVHKHKEHTCCCCYRLESVYDQVACCSFGQSKCTSITTNNSCRLSVMECWPFFCCSFHCQKDYDEDFGHAKEISGCFGPTVGSGCIYEYRRVIAPQKG